MYFAPSPLAFDLVTGLCGWRPVTPLKLSTSSHSGQNRLRHWNDRLLWSRMRATDERCYCSFVCGLLSWTFSNYIRI